ncbi:MAG: NAD(P)/FAD-dependent oxidoreductase [Bacteroidota bacterium]
MRIVVIGGGAAGFFAAINAASANAEAEVIILEKTAKLLQKVKISGGGRCNVTNACTDLKQLSLSYPRGEKHLKSAFSRFTTTDTVKWFESRKVKLKAEPDGRMFPVSDDSQTIIDCLMKEVKKLKIEILTNKEVRRIETRDLSFKVYIADGENIECNKVIVTTGGGPKEEQFNWIKTLGHEIIAPVPSLFTFNLPNNPITELTGVSVNPVKIRIPDLKLENNGPLLITHWGLSGPSVLRLSSFGARLIAEKNYHFEVIISWLNDKKEESCRNELMNIKAANPNRQVNNLFPFKLPGRLLDYLFEKSTINPKLNWAEISKEQVNKLVQALLYDSYQVEGKTGFKEEFVTCGGVNLNEIDFKTMQSRKIKGLYFAGEVLDIDGVTGGFNFQSAWTTGFLAGVGAGS